MIDSLSPGKHRKTLKKMSGSKEDGQDPTRAQVTSNGLHTNFILPRKKNSAIWITKPKTNHQVRAQPAEISPSEELARAFSTDSHEVDAKWPKVGATVTTSELAAVSSNGAQLLLQQATVGKNISGTRQPAETRVELATSKPSKAKPSVHAQLAEVTKVLQEFQPRSTAHSLQNHPTQSPKTIIALPAPATSQQSTAASHTTIDPSNSSLDVYAANYVPQYLRAINDSPAQKRMTIPLPIINYAQYIASFAGFSVLRPLDYVHYNLVKPKDLKHEIPVSTMHEQAYGTYLNERLQRELGAQVTELQELALYNVSFDVADPGQNLYRFRIPGIRENTPRIDLGDIVLVRPWLCSAHEGLAEAAKIWYAAGGARTGTLAPGFNGFEFQAVVWGLQRAREEVVLRLDGFLPNAIRICNLNFVLQDYRLASMYRAIRKSADQFHQAGPLTQQWIRSMLFPTTSDGVPQAKLSQGSFDLQWYDKQLNFEQQKAVDAIVKSKYGTLPFLVSGPPGTGKTKTLVESTMQLLRSADLAGRRCHLLVCAPSDSAADTIATRLKVHLNQMELFRLNGWTRSFAEVPEHLMLHSYTESDLFAVPAFQTMMTFKVVVTTCRDADMLVQARLTNADLAQLATQISMVSPGLSGIPLSLHWSALLLDEAAQATEPEALIPLAVLQPGPEPPEGFQSLAQIVMAGDEHQLGPRLSLHSDSGLQKSLFQRIFERLAYSDHPLSRKNGSKPLTASMLPILRAPFVNLIRNYRSHPAILTIPSVLFYHDTLMPEVTAISPAVASWPGWKGSQRWPVLFVQNDSPDSVESILAGNGTGAGALLNAGEALLAEGVVMSLVSGNDPASHIEPHEITVMSPYRAQVNYLRKAFRTSGLASVNIGPLEAFQGLESRVVIICTTRTRRDGRDAGRFIREDQARGIGLIGDAKKFNVAITRAREGLIIIGDRECLTCTHDLNWIAFLAFCERNGCVDVKSGRWDSLSSDILPGRMERALMYASQAKEREMEAQVLKGFGYPTQPGRALRGNIPTSDEEMWADGMRLAEENAVNEEDGEEVLDTEDDVIQETERTTTPLLPPTVTTTPEGKQISISSEGNREGSGGKANARIQPATPAALVRDRDSLEASASASAQLVSISPDRISEKEHSQTKMGDEPEHVFDRDLDAEIRKEQEGCGVQ